LAGVAAAVESVVAALSSVFGFEQAKNSGMAKAMAIVFFMLEVFDD
jgi:hypothetical protein